MTSAGAAPVLRSISPQDVTAVLELNALNVWALSPMDEDLLIRLLGWADREGAGDRGGSPSKPKQLSRADMARMTPDQIVAADDAGQFDDLKAGRH